MKTFWMLRSWLGWLNFFLLQWFFLRLQEVLEDDGKTHVRWQVVTGIVPLTGWWSNYVYLWKRKLDFRWRKSA